MARRFDFSFLPEEPPEPSVVARCAACRGDIYDGEVCAVGAVGFVCADCIDDMWQELSITEKIERLGMEATRIERIVRK